MSKICIVLCKDDQEFQLIPNPKLFNDSGIAPDGRWWIAPTSLFINRLWHNSVGDDLKGRGFRLENNGHCIGAFQPTVIYLPVGEL